MHDTYNIHNIKRTNTDTKGIMDSIYETVSYQLLSTSAFTKALLRSESADPNLQDVYILSFKVVYNANPTDSSKPPRSKHNLDHVALCSNFLQLKGR